MRLVEQARFLDAEIDPKFEAVLAKRVGAEGVFVDELTKMLAQATPGSLTLEKGARYIGMLQQTGHMNWQGNCAVVSREIRRQFGRKAQGNG